MITSILEPELISKLETHRVTFSERINNVSDVLNNVQKSEKELNRWMYDNLCSFNLLAFRKDEGKSGLWSVEDQILFAFSDYYAIWECITSSLAKEDTMLDLLTIVKNEIDANYVETNDSIEICTEDEELFDDLERLKAIKQEKASMPLIMLYARFIFESERRLALTLRGSWDNAFGLVVDKINKLADIIIEEVPKLPHNGKREQMAVPPVAVPPKPKEENMGQDETKTVTLPEKLDTPLIRLLFGILVEAKMLDEDFKPIGSKATTNGLIIDSIASIADLKGEWWPLFVKELWGKDEKVLKNMKSSANIALNQRNGGVKVKLYNTISGAKNRKYVNEEGKEEALEDAPGYKQWSIRYEKKE